MAPNVVLLPRHNGDHAGAFTHYCAIYALWVQLHEDQLLSELAREIAQRHGNILQPREEAGRQQAGMMHSVYLYRSGTPFQLQKWSQARQARHYDRYNRLQNTMARSHSISDLKSLA